LTSFGQADAVQGHFFIQHDATRKVAKEWQSPTAFLRVVCGLDKRIPALKYRHSLK
jgi:hypothetical protein